MDTIFFNGCIRTLDNSEKVAEAVGIENGRIVFVGTDKEAEAFSCKKRIDLKGRLMLPGFVDTHMHMLHYAFVERSVKLFDCTSVEEMLAAAKKRLEESKGQKLTWLYCRGWNEEHFDKYASGACPRQKNIGARQCVQRRACNPTGGNPVK